MRDILKKLLFSLEQTSMTNIELGAPKPKTTAQDLSSPSTKPANIPALPNLLIAQGTNIKTQQQ